MSDDKILKFPGHTDEDAKQEPTAPEPSNGAEEEMKPTPGNMDAARQRMMLALDGRINSLTQQALDQPLNLKLLLGTVLAIYDMSVDVSQAAVNGKQHQLGFYANIKETVITHKHGGQKTVLAGIRLESPFCVNLIESVNRLIQEGGQNGDEAKKDTESKTTGSSEGTDQE